MMSSTHLTKKPTTKNGNDFPYILVWYDSTDQEDPIGQHLQGTAGAYNIVREDEVIIFVDTALPETEQNIATRFEEFKVSWVLELQGEEEAILREFGEDFNIVRIAHILAWGQLIVEEGWTSVKDSTFLMNELGNMTDEELADILSDRSVHQQLRQKYLADILNAKRFEKANIFKFVYRKFLSIFVEPPSVKQLENINQFELTTQEYARHMILNSRFGIWNEDSLRQHAQSFVERAQTLFELNLGFWNPALVEMLTKPTAYEAFIRIIQELKGTNRNQIIEALTLFNEKIAEVQNDLEFEDFSNSFDYLKPVSDLAPTELVNNIAQDISFEDKIAFYHALYQYLPELNPERLDQFENSLLSIQQTYLDINQWDTLNRFGIKPLVLLRYIREERITHDTVEAFDNYFVGDVNIEFAPELVLEVPARRIKSSYYVRNTIRRIIGSRDERGTFVLSAGILKILSRDPNYPDITGSAMKHLTTLPSEDQLLPATNEELYSLAQIAPNKEQRNGNDFPYILVWYDSTDQEDPIGQHLQGTAGAYNIVREDEVIIFVDTALPEAEQRIATRFEEFKVSWVLELQGEEEAILREFGEEFNIVRIAHILAWGQLIVEEGWTSVKDSTFLMNELGEMTDDELADILSDRSVHQQLRQKYLADILDAKHFEKVDIFKFVYREFLSIFVEPPSVKQLENINQFELTIQEYARHMILNSRFGLWNEDRLGQHAQSFVERAQSLFETYLELWNSAVVIMLTEPPAFEAFIRIIHELKGTNRDQIIEALALFNEKITAVQNGFDFEKFTLPIDIHKPVRSLTPIELMKSITQDFPFEDKKAFYRELYQNLSEIDLEKLDQFENALLSIQQAYFDITQWDTLNRLGIGPLVLLHRSGDEKMTHDIVEAYDNYYVGDVNAVYGHDLVLEVPVRRIKSSYHVAHTIRRIIGSNAEHGAIVLSAGILKILSRDSNYPGIIGSAMKHVPMSPEEDRLNRDGEGRLKVHAHEYVLRTNTEPVPITINGEEVPYFLVKYSSVDPEDKIGALLHNMAGAFNLVGEVNYIFMDISMLEEEQAMALEFEEYKISWIIQLMEESRIDGKSIQERENLPEAFDELRISHISAWGQLIAEHGWLDVEEMDFLMKEFGRDGVTGEDLKDIATADRSVHRRLRERFLTDERYLARPLSREQLENVNRVEESVQTYAENLIYERKSGDQLKESSKTMVGILSSAGLKIMYLLSLPLSPLGLSNSSILIWPLSHSGKSPLITQDMKTRVFQGLKAQGFPISSTFSSKESQNPLSFPHFSWDQKIVIPIAPDQDNSTLTPHYSIHEDALIPLWQAGEEPTLLGKLLSHHVREDIYNNQAALSPQSISEILPLFTQPGQAIQNVPWILWNKARGSFVVQSPTEVDDSPDWNRTISNILNILKDSVLSEEDKTFYRNIGQALVEIHGMDILDLTNLILPLDKNLLGENQLLFEVRPEILAIIEGMTLAIQAKNSDFIIVLEGVEKEIIYQVTAQLGIPKHLIRESFPNPQEAVNAARNTRGDAVPLRIWASASQKKKYAALKENLSISIIHADLGEPIRFENIKAMMLYEWLQERKLHQGHGIIYEGNQLTIQNRPLEQEDTQEDFLTTLTILIQA